MKERNRSLLEAAGVELPEPETPEPTQVVEAETPNPELATWQANAAKVYGLPEALARRLTGHSAAGVMGDAAKLSEELAAPKSPRAEAVVLARQAARHAAELRNLGPGFNGGKLSPPPETVGQPIPRQRERPVPYEGD